jgi:two-component system LytT family response regulator
MTLRVLVVDDELQARKRLVRLLEPLDYDVTGSCANAEEALALLDSLKPDVLLLDISMPGISGLEAARTRFPTTLSIIFVTAHADHAIDAFDLGAADYILKPVTTERLVKALARIAERRATARAAELGAPITRIPIETRTGTVLVDPHTIAYAHFDGALVTLFAANESWVTTLTLKDLEDRLGPSFVRVDRRHVLNLREVARIEPNDSGGATAITRSGFRVPVSRQARRDLAKRLDL